MPAIICGPIIINNITGNGDVQFGDSLFNSPKVASKTPAGAGGFNTGAFILSNTLASSTNYIDPNVIDMPVAGNN
ncbi:spore germination protein [Neobacillus niacini]|uniref:spore germination protein n=1 Tax=Neobacillus niacini TaxID=86668 RepID=UPI0021CB651C|nr:spore germination protein [Neobacillus niacini]MCM3766315.1 spore germination protein [Neobacillus niacini]